MTRTQKVQENIALGEVQTASNYLYKLQYVEHVAIFLHLLQL